MTMNYMTLLSWDKMVSSKKDICGDNVHLLFDIVDYTEFNDTPDASYSLLCEKPLIHSNGILYFVFCKTRVLTLSL